jgi:hypothetical protein
MIVRIDSITAQKGMKTLDGQFLTTKTKQLQEIRAIRLKGLDDNLDFAFALETFGNNDLTWTRRDKSRLRQLTVMRKQTASGRSEVIAIVGSPNG